MSFSSVNLLWQKRLRGLMPLAPHAVGDSGQALLIRPDEMERRTYQVLSGDPDGVVRELSAISVERVYRFDAVPDGRLLLGMTGDDIYLFRDSKKARFMTERRVTYADAVLAPETGWFVCGFSDTLFAQHGIAFGDAAGRMGWHRDMDVPVERVALTHDGRTLAIGLSDGRVEVLDNLRVARWETGLDEEITALTMPGSGPQVVAGTAGGSVMSLDEDGGFNWRSPVGVPVVAVSVDARNRWVAAVHSDGGTHLLVCLGPDGAPVWEHELDAKPTGVGLSPNGRFLVVTTASGTATAFDVDFAAAPTYTLGGRRTRDLAAADSAVSEGNLAQAYGVLAGLADAAPWDEEIATRRAECLAALLRKQQSDAEALAEQGSWSEALLLWEEAARLAPYDEELFRARLAFRDRAIAGLEEHSRTLEATFDREGAGRVLGQVLALDPNRASARAALQQLRQDQAAELAREGERLAEDDPAAAIQLWTRAQELHPDPALATRLRQAEVQRCLTTGIALYEAGRSAEALFQFRKALAMDPGNETAQRYLGYTESVSVDTTIADRFARLE